MRVLLVNDYFPGPGSGAETHLLRLKHGLEAAGDTVEVFPPPAARSGIGRAFDLWDPASRAALRRRVDITSPDVVHFHNVIRELSASVLGAPRRAARVMTVHDLRLAGVPDGPEGRPFDAAAIRLIKMAKARVERFIAHRAVDAFVAPTHATARLLAAAGFERIHVVPHFAPAATQGGPPSARTDVVVAGRLSPEKGVGVLVEAFGSVADKHRDANLVIAGGGPERGRLERLASLLPPGRVRFTGMLDEAGVRGAMHEARIVVAPSLAREVAGLTVIEAALAGRPVIVSDDPAQRELVDAASCGIVTPRGDAAALADAIDRLLGDGDLADRLGAAGRTAASAVHSVESGIAATRNVYEAAMARRRGRG